ncbi:YicC/YloC family endoribonuclease [Roseobacter sp. HKCCA0434]|uniref:YicC/YloC family endoribonuclease n=1 Tax=Roseobacter sp. HKCCA0434 TaxID=3079297 RepID=UPI002905D804|nr:YicC/YloC family endoribonuclease [Roseobacter sp. HKCCA0434]
MTGFARRDGSHGAMSWVWEARSVNARGLDLRLRLPDTADALDGPLRTALKGPVARGAVTISLRYSRGQEAAGADDAAVDRTLAAIAVVEEAARRAGRDLAPIRATDILALRGQFEASGPDTAWVAEAAKQIDGLVADLVASRGREGAALDRILTDTLDRIEALLPQARETATARATRTAVGLSARVAAVMQAAPDPARLEQELALLAVKADVTEELDRLDAHVAAARELVATGGPVGRKLDFLMQEFNREANTLASKSGDTALTAIALDLKVAIDQMREQVQNVE